MFGRLSSAFATSLTEDIFKTIRRRLESLGALFFISHEPVFYPASMKTYILPKLN